MGHEPLGDSGLNLGSQSFCMKKGASKWRRCLQCAGKPLCGCSCLQDVLLEGDRISAVVIDMNGTANRISLSTKVLEVEPGDMMQGKVGSLMF